MIKKCFGFASASFAALALVTSAAWAGGDLAKAKEEGKVVWYSSLSLYKFEAQWGPAISWPSSKPFASATNFSTCCSSEAGASVVLTV